MVATLDLVVVQAGGELPLDIGDGGERIGDGMTRDGEDAAVVEALRHGAAGDGTEMGRRRADQWYLLMVGEGVGRRVRPFAELFWLIA